MEGVMMRNGDVYGLAVRQPDGGISAQRLPWRTVMRSPWLRAPFVRGFPILIETMINGIQALNRSVALSEGSGEGGDKSALALAFSLFLAIIMAVALFVAAPHALSVLMLWLGLGGDVEGLSFHLWDGFYKCAIFVGYIWLISLVPDIRRVFEYHGAEHKTIRAWEAGAEMSPASACHMSRLHPRCGTTFLLFVICVSILIQALAIPWLLALWTPAGALAKHAYSVSLKLLLIIPISAAAYELIRFAASLPAGSLASLLQAPGLALQRLTTREPTPAQLDVALAALACALGPEKDPFFSCESPDGDPAD